MAISKPGQEQGRAGTFPVQPHSFCGSGDLAQSHTLGLVDDLVKPHLWLEKLIPDTEETSWQHLDAQVSMTRFLLGPDRRLE